MGVTRLATQQGCAPLVRVLFDNRVIALCPEHRELVQRACVSRLDELFELTRQTDERRAVLSRRSPLNRRVFPARPEGRRQSDGRRDTDGG
jgi:hypothetical protein